MSTPSNEAPPRAREIRIGDLTTGEAQLSGRALIPVALALDAHAAEQAALIAEMERQRLSLAEANASYRAAADLIIERLRGALEESHVVLGDLPQTITEDWLNRRLAALKSATSVLNDVPATLQARAALCVACGKPEGEHRTMVDGTPFCDEADRGRAAAERKVIEVGLRQRKARREMNVAGIDAGLKDLIAALDELVALEGGCVDGCPVHREARP